MAQGFDFIDSAVKGYKAFWTLRHVIVRLSVIPFAIKLAGFFLITALEMTGNILRQGLVLLPSYFAEGWLVAVVIRMAVLGEHWPIRSSGDLRKDETFLLSRARGISAAMIIYVLVKMALAVFSAGVLREEMLEPAARPAEPGIGIMLAALAGIMLLIWAFRFLWIYIPAALDKPIMEFLKRIGGLMGSVYMLGTWLLCFVPPAMFLLFCIQILSAAFPAQAENAAGAYIYSLVFFQAATELAMALLTSLGLAFGIYALYNQAGQER